MENMYYTAKCTMIFLRRPHILIPRIAKKEDDPEQALKEFKAIVDKEEEKGDWYALILCYHPRMADWAGTGDLRRSNSRQNYCS